MSGPVPYLGADISLVSKANIRYEGTLYTVDAKQATVALQNVTCFGTEGRAANPEEEVAGSADVYEFIIFRGSDIQDLHVVQKKAPVATRPPRDPAIVQMRMPRSADAMGSPPSNFGPPPSWSGAQQDPVFDPRQRPQPTRPLDGGRPQQHSQHSQFPQHSQRPQHPAAQQRPPQHRQQQQQQQPPRQQHHPQQNQQERSQQNGEQSGTNETPPSKNRRARRRAQAQGPVANKPAAATVGNPLDYSGPGSGTFLNRSGQQIQDPKAAFDFESSNKRFDKEKYLENVAKMAQLSVSPQDDAKGDAKGDAKDDSKDSAEPDGDKQTEGGEEGDGLSLPTVDPAPTMPVVECGYNKSKSFFDTISTDRDIRGSGKRIMDDRGNVETFGEDAHHHRSGRYNRRRGYHTGAGNYGGDGRAYGPSMAPRSYGQGHVHRPGQGQAPRVAHAQGQQRPRHNDGRAQGRSRGGRDPRRATGPRSQKTAWRRGEKGPAKPRAVPQGSAKPKAAPQGPAKPKAVPQSSVKPKAVPQKPAPEQQK